MQLSKNQTLERLRNTPAEAIKHEAWRRGVLEWKLHAVQLEYWRLIQNTDYILSVFHASRGLGKTWFYCFLIATMALRIKGGRGAYFAKSRSSAKEIFLPTWNLFSADAPPGLFEWQAHEHKLICNETNTYILIEGAEDDPNKLRGPFLHFGVFDEAGFWRNLEDVRTIFYDQLRRRGGRGFMGSTTPETPGHEFYAYKLEAQQHGTYFTADSRRNPMMAPEELDKIAEAMGGWNSNVFRREHLNEDVIDTERAVIPEYDVDKHVFDEREFERGRQIFNGRPVFCDKYVFLDLGLIDFTAALFAYYDFEEAKLVIEDEVVVNFKTTSEIACAIIAKENELWGNEKVTLRISDNEAQQIVDMARTHGLHFVPADKYDNEAAINKLRTGFANNQILIHSRCLHLRHQLRVGIWNKGRTQFERLPGAGHLDCIDALKYGWRMLRRNNNPVPANYGHTHQDSHIPGMYAKKPRTAYEGALRKYGLVKK